MWILGNGESELKIRGTLTNRFFYYYFEYYKESKYYVIYFRSDLDIFAINGLMNTILYNYF